MASLYIGGQAMPEPKKNGLDIKHEKIWSKKTGRGSDGTMLGDIIAYKTTLTITWPPLSQSEAALIDAAVAPSFFNVTYREVGGAAVTKTFYSDTPSYPVYSYVQGVSTYQGVQVQLIEQ
ncbi:MAG: hypothetical protein IJ899_20830 [Blautia sp.]|nr:hypothetical protein [Blautia sp.]